MSASSPEGRKEFAFVPYTLADGRKIDLIGPELLPHLPEGTELTNIMGKTLIVGTDIIDSDVHSGMLAFGLPSKAKDNNTYLAPLPDKLL